MSATRLPEGPLLLSVREAAIVLGIGRNLVYQLVREGRLPHVKLGRRVLIPRHALEEWLDREAGATLADDGIDLSDRSERAV